MMNLSAKQFHVQEFVLLEGSTPCIRLSRSSSLYLLIDETSLLELWIHFRSSETAEEFVLLTNLP